MTTVTHRAPSCLGPVGTTGPGFTISPYPPGWEIACRWCHIVTYGPRLGQYVSKDDPHITSHGSCESCNQTTIWEQFRAGLRKNKRGLPVNVRGEVVPDWHGQAMWEDMMDGLKAEARSATLRSARNQRRGGRAQG